MTPTHAHTQHRISYADSDSDNGNIIMAIDTHATMTRGQYQPIGITDDGRIAQEKISGHESITIVIQMEPLSSTGASYPTIKSTVTLSFDGCGMNRRFLLIEDQVSRTLSAYDAWEPIPCQLVADMARPIARDLMHKLHDADEMAGLIINDLRSARDAEKKG